MRVWLASAMMAATAFCAATANAQTAKSEEILAKYEACTTHGTGHLLGNYTFEQRLSVCSAGINSHAYQGQDLAAFYFNRSTLLNDIGQTAAAQKDVEAAFRAWPNIVDTVALRAQAYDRAEQPDLVRAALDWVERVAPNSYNLHFARASIHLAHNELELARKEIAAAVALKPDGVNALSVQAQIQAASGDVDGALAAADHAVTLDPHSAIAYNLRCYIRALAGRDLSEKALPDCNMALELQPKSPAIMDSRGFTYLQLGRYAEAIADYNAAINTADQPSAASLYGRGLAERKTGDTMSAEADISAAEALSPGIEKKFGTLAMLL